MYLFVGYSIPFLITSLALCFALSLMFSRKAWQDGTNRLLQLWLLAGLEWGLCSLMESMAVDQGTKILWSQLEYIGGLSCAPLMLLFALRFTHLVRRLRPWAVALGFLPTMAGIVLGFSNAWHGLIWTGFHPGPAGTNSLVYEHGPAFYLIVVLFFVYVLFGSILFILESVRTWRAFRGQSLLMLGGILVSWFLYFFYLVDTDFLPGLDFSPLGMGVTAILIAYGVYRMQLLDLQAVARDQVLEHMEDGVVVLDWQGRLVDYNRSAQRYLGDQVSLEVGQPFQFPRIWESEWKAAGGQPVDLFMPVVTGHGLWFTVKQKALGGRKDRPWTILSFREITERKLAEDRLRDQYRRVRDLEAILREQAFRDSLTGLHNRRFLDEALPREITRAKREQVDFCVLMVDIDHFKSINDRYGHAAGDQVLIGIGGLIASFFRDSDLSCRFGGEEFVILLWHTSQEAGLAKAEQFRQAFSGMDLGEDFTTRPSVSIGVSVWRRDGTDGEGLLRAADKALYQAKAGGRNRVCLADPSA